MAALRNGALGLALFGALIAIPTPSFAQDGAMWRDDRGRPMELTFSGGNGTPPAPMAFALDDMAQGFVRLCVETLGDQEAVAKAAEAEGLLVSITDSPVPEKAPKAKMVMAKGPGLVVTQTVQILAYGYTQCNVNYFPDALPEPEDVASALMTVLGRKPDNEADRFKKNGKPNKGFKPQWQITGDDGTVFALQFDVMKSNPYLNGNRVLFGLREVLENK
jgi:hypothetical protein